MRNLSFFRTKKEYEEYIWDGVFTEPWVRATPFYRNLINYIVDHRAPLFYDVSDKSEHFAFSGAYHFETRRETYPSAAREQLFWLHDFTHLLFPYPHDIYDVSEAEFLKQFWYQERIASSETEIFSYYRVPELRDLVFPDEKIYYDVVRERGYGNRSRQYSYSGWGGKKPDANIFYHHRVLLCMDDQYGEEELGDHPDILKFFRMWRTLTPKWITERYRYMVGRRIPPHIADLHSQSPFTVNNYEARVNEYGKSERPGQGYYERKLLDNVRMAFGLLDWDDMPEKFDQVPEAVQRLEGAVFFK